MHRLIEVNNFSIQIKAIEIVPSLGSRESWDTRVEWVYDQLLERHIEVTTGGDSIWGFTKEEVLDRAEAAITKWAKLQPNLRLQS